MFRPLFFCFCIFFDIKEDWRLCNFLLSFLLLRLLCLPTYFFGTTWVVLFCFGFYSYTVRNKILFLPVPEKCFKLALFYNFSEPNLNCNAECSLASGLLALFICCGISTCTTSMLTAVSLFKHPHFLARCENIFRNFELIRQ